MRGGKAKNGMKACASSTLSEDSALRRSSMPFDSLTLVAMAFAACQRAGCLGEWKRRAVAFVRSALKCLRVPLHRPAFG